MAFPDDERAGRARAALIAGGFSEGEVTQYDKNEVIVESEKSLKQETNPIQIGQDVAKAEEYLAFAKEGCGFLMVHAPEEDGLNNRPFRSLALRVLLESHFFFDFKLHHLVFKISKLLT